MRYLTLTFLSLLACQMTQRLPRGCEKWFVFHPSRCTRGSMYLKWCKIGGPRICSFINPKEFPTSTPAISGRPTSRTQATRSFTRATPAFTRGNPILTRATRGPPRANAASTRATFATRILTRPTTAARLATTLRTPRPTATPMRVTAAKTSARPNPSRGTQPTPPEQGNNLKHIENEANQRQIVLELIKGTEVVGAGNQNVKSRMADKRVNDALLKCAQDNGVSPECTKFANFNLTISEAEKLVCQQPECVVFIAEMTYCATNGKNKYQSCCKPMGIDPICERFCNGQKPIVVQEMFPDVVAAIDYYPCFEKRYEIQQCLGATHSGRLEAKKRTWPSGDIDPELVELTRELACEPPV